jgi:hypothetical protein
VGVLLPPAWGIRAPLRLDHSRSAAEPLYLDRTDLLVDALGGIRATSTGWTRLDLEVSRDSVSRHPAARALLDPLRLRVGLDRSSETLPFSGSEGRRMDARLDYLWVPAARLLEVPLAGAVRWSPTRLSLSGGWTDGHRELLRYSGILRADSSTRANEAWEQRLHSGATIALRPVETLSGGLRVTSGRDLLDPHRQSPEWAERLAAERRSLLGVDLGRERDRALHTDLDWAPRPAAWLQPRLSTGGSFAADRDVSYLSRSRDGNGPGVPASFEARRERAARLRLEPSALDGRLNALKTVELGWTRTLESRFDRVMARPGAAYKLAVAGDAGFLRMAGDTASFLRDRTRRHGRVQLGLPGALRFSAGWAERTTTLRVRQEQMETERESPALTLDWEPRGERLPGALASLSLGSGFTHRTRRRDDGTPGPATDVVERAVPIRAALRTRLGLGASYRGEWRVEEGSTPWAETRRFSLDHALSLNGSLAPPGLLRPRVHEPLAVSLQYVRAARRDCRMDSLASCGVENAFAGYLDEVLRAQVDARVDGMSYGVHVEYREREGLVGERAGNRRFYLGLFGEFTMSAGTMH